MEDGSRSRARRQTEPQSFTVLVIRAWMWLVPVAILAASAIFGTIAALDERWGLLIVMVVMAVFAVGLMLLHWWLLYRFGTQAAGGER